MSLNGISHSAEKDTSVIDEEAVLTKKCRPEDKVTEKEKHVGFNFFFIISRFICRALFHTENSHSVVANSVAPLLITKRPSSTSKHESIWSTGEGTRNQEILVPF